MAITFYRQCAIIYTDFWEAYKTVIPSSIYRLSKFSSETNHVKTLNNTLLSNFVS